MVRQVAPDTWTHYIPAFTRRDTAGQQQTVCGVYIPASQQVGVEQTPTCPGCRVWVEQVERPHSAA
jgi:hypothetical protein